MTEKKDYKRAIDLADVVMRRSYAERAGKAKLYLATIAGKGWTAPLAAFDRENDAEEFKRKYEDAMSYANVFADDAALEASIKVSSTLYMPATGASTKAGEARMELQPATSADEREKSRPQAGQEFP